MQSETVCGDQGCRPLGARSTISYKLDLQCPCAAGILQVKPGNCRNYILAKNHFKVLCQAFFQESVPHPPKQAIWSIYIPAEKQKNPTDSGVQGKEYIG